MKPINHHLNLAALTLAFLAAACGEAAEEDATRAEPEASAEPEPSAEDAMGADDTAEPNEPSPAEPTPAAGPSSPPVEVPPPEPPDATGAVFSDDFENDTAWLAQWEVVQGTCDLSMDGTQALTCINGGNEARVFALNQTFTDLTVTANVKIRQMDAGKRIHLAGRYTDSNNWYGAALYNSGTRKVQIRKKVDGSSSDIASVDHPFEFDTWYTLSLSITGTTLSLSLDGVPMLEGMDMDFASGSVGLLVDASEVAWDNVVVITP